MDYSWKTGGSPGQAMCETPDVRYSTEKDKEAVGYSCGVEEVGERDPHWGDVSSHVKEWDHMRSRSTAVLNPLDTTPSFERQIFW